MDTSSVACFRYTLPIFFIYLINEYLSNPEDRAEVLTVDAEDIGVDKAMAEGTREITR